MKAKITKKDGTIIELEGTAAELGQFIDPPKVTIGPAPSCPGIGPTSIAPTDFGKFLDELMKGQKDSRPYQPTYPVQPIDLGHWKWLTPYVYNDACPMGGAHDYPTVWNAIFPPPCSKCGKSSGPTLGTTIVSTQTVTLTPPASQS